MNIKGEDYTQEYRARLLELDKKLRDNGIEATEHALNRIIGRLNSNKASYRILQIEDIIEALLNGEKYIDIANGGYVIFRSEVALHFSDSGELKTVTRTKKVKSSWQKSS